MRTATERGTGGEDRNGEGDPKGLPYGRRGEDRNGEDGSPARTGRAGPDPLHARVHATLVYLIVFDASSHVTALRRK